MGVCSLAFLIGSLVDVVVEGSINAVKSLLDVLEAVSDLKLSIKVGSVPQAQLQEASVCIGQGVPFGEVFLNNYVFYIEIERLGLHISTTRYGGGVIVD